MDGCNKLLSKIMLNTYYYYLNKITNNTFYSKTKNTLYYQ